ncbi:hypothetical protein EDB86DRAFT_1178984 [Lactarius hatsudake]|nr:hypothetical protein EDB86DRAFT_1178984 [Lactarius hatsudake]
MLCQCGAGDPQKRFVSFFFFCGHWLPAWLHFQEYRVFLRMICYGTPLFMSTWNNDPTCALGFLLPWHRRRGARVVSLTRLQMNKEYKATLTHLLMYAPPVVTGIHPLLFILALAVTHGVEASHFPSIKRTNNTVAVRAYFERLIPTSKDVTLLFWCTGSEMPVVSITLGSLKAHRTTYPGRGHPLMTPNFYEHK